MYELVVQQRIEVVTLVEENSKESVQRRAAENKAEAIQKLAEAAKKPQKPAKGDHIVLIYPEDPADSSDALKHKIKQSIDPKDLKIKIKEVKNVKDGGVLIKTNSKEEARILEETIKNTGGLGTIQTRVPTKRNPRIVISGFEKDTQEELVTAAIKEHFNLEPTFKFPIPGKDSTHFVYEVIPEDLQKLKGQKVSISWSTATISEFIRPVQCYKCFRFGHFAFNCRLETRCGRCSSKKHRQDNCDKKSTNCHLCKNLNTTKGTNLSTNHSPRDLNCGARKQEVAILKKRINYG